MSLFGFSMPRLRWAKLLLIAGLMGIIVVYLEFLQDIPEPWGLIVSYLVTVFIVFVAIIIGIKMSLKRDMKLDTSI